MRAGWRIGIALLFLEGALWAVAAPPTGLPPEAVRFHARLIGKVQPSVRAWIGGEAARLAKAPTVNEGGLRAAVRARFAGQTLPPSDIEALVELIMFEAAQAAEQDLRDLVAEMHKVNDAKEKLRDLMEKMKRQVAEHAGRNGRERCAPPRCGGFEAAAGEAAAALRAAGARTRLNVGPMGTLDDLRVRTGEWQKTLDEMNEMSELASLRLQMAMDRRSKLLTTLSNTMKKISTTAETLVQNLK